MQTSPRKVSDLRPAEYNPRTISEAQLKALAAALKEFGDLSGIILNQRTGNLIGGHQRIKTLDKSWPIKLVRSSKWAEGETLDKCGTIASGAIETPFGDLAYRLVDWPEQKEKAANLAANKHGGDWDLPKLKELLVELDTGAFDLSLTGFDPKELQALIDYGANVPMPNLGSESEKLFEQMTFVLSREQADLVRAAIGRAIADGPFEGTGNENKNGNALARIAGAYDR